jgi:PAS domain S-box-containing protein
MNVPDEDSLAQGQHESLQLYQERSLLALLISVSVAGPIVTGGVYLRDGAGPLMAVGMVLTALVWLLLTLFYAGHRQRVASLLVYLLLCASAAAIAAHGTVRSMASLVMLASVVGAGTFLSRRNMIISASLAVLLLAILNAAENLGYLPTPQTKTGWAVWITQTTVLISLVITVNFGRRRLQDAFREQVRALTMARSAASELASSEARFRALFSNNPAASVVQSVEKASITDVNEAFLALFGYTREELVGHDVPDLWADPQALLEFQRVLRERGRVSRLQAQGQRKDGTPFDALVFSEVVTHGSEHMVVTMVLDVSAEKESVRQLEKSQERFTKAFNFSPLGMTITRLSDGRFMEVNPANQRVLGYTQEDFQGQTALSANVWLTTEDRNHYVETLTRNGQLEAYETRMRNKAGEVTEVRIWAEIIELDGEPSALSYTMNVSAEKRREALLLETAKGVSGETGELFFRSLVQHMSKVLQAELVIAGEIHKEGTVETVAAAFMGAIVPNIQYELEGTPCSHTVQAFGECFYADHLADRFPADKFPIGGGYQTYIGVALRDADGSPIGILKALWQGNTALTSDTQALMTIFSSRCNAELVRMRRDREIQRLRETLERRVEERTGQLEQLNRELDSFAYTVSHDLKSPLRTIGGFTHLLREQLAQHLTVDDHKLFNRIEMSVGRMNALIVDLLALARVSQGDLQRKEVDLAVLANEVMLLTRAGEPHRAVQMRIEAPLMANCDDRLAHIVLENLLGNAWKYTSNTTEALIDFGQRPGQPGDAPVFYIKDNGAGFDMGRSDRLFKPFNRLHASNEFEGSGIGLATVRRILERHGGFIRGEGVPGLGATFDFSFGGGESL